MRLTAYATLGMEVMVELARGDGPIATRELARRLEVKYGYVQQAMLRLNNASLVIPTRGPKGGYELARPAEKITLLQVIEAADKRPILEPSQREAHSRSTVRDQVRAYVRECLGNKTIQDLCRAGKSGRRRRARAKK